MNHFTKLKTGVGFSLSRLLLSLLLFVSVGVQATSYKKITSMEDLEVGKNYLIVYESGTTGYVMGSVSGDYMGSVQATISDGVLTLPDNANVIVLGGTSAGYTLKTSLNNQYLYYVGTKTYLTTNGTVSNNTKWTIEFVNGFAHIANVKDATRYVKFYTNTNTFRAYTTSSGALVSLYKEDTPSGPSITADDVTYDADATTGEISYTINNGDDSKLSASSETTWISNVKVDAEKVTFDMDENTDTAPREGVVKLTYGSVTKDVKVTQKAPVIKYTITWSVNGTRTTEQVEQGQPITFDNAPAGIPEGYVFTGWYGEEYSNETDAPTYVSSATATADATYYAVFAIKSGGGEGIATLEATLTNGNTSYDDHTYTDNQGFVWHANNTELKENNVARYGLRNSNGSHVESPEFPGSIKEIVITTYNGSASETRYFYIDSNKETKKGDLGKVTAPKGDKSLSPQKAVLTEGADFKKFYVNVSAALGFSSIKVTYSSATYSDFRTSLADNPEPTTATITLSEKCTAGEIYYGTYSSTKPFVVSGEISVSEISVIDNELVVYEYSTGDVVPANTGVMVSALSSGDFTVNLSDEAGTSVLGEENMLRPTGDTGISAEEMVAKENEACKYYRLTMHKGETLGFFYGAAEGAAFSLGANKAYLAVPETVAAKVLGFAIGGNATGIGAVIDNGNAAGQRTVYNLQGQRVSGKPAKGVYIVNGKKMIVR